MLWRFVVVCSVLLGTAVHDRHRLAQATARSAAARIVYVALGDSLTSCLGVDDPATQCYPAVLAHSLPRGGRLLNLGIEGETAEGALSTELPQALAAHPTLATVMLGGNDVGAVAVAIFRASLDHMLAALRRSHARVFVATIPDFRLMPGHRTDAALFVQERPFNAAIVALAKRHGATVVDVYAVSQSLWGHPGFVTQDGIHLTPAGYRALAAVFHRVMHSHGAL